jgi:hypothetical protein
MKKFTIVKFLEEYRKMSKKINVYRKKARFWEEVQRTLVNDVRATLNIELREVKDN